MTTKTSCIHSSFIRLISHHQTWGSDMVEWQLVLYNAGLRQWCQRNTCQVSIYSSVRFLLENFSYLPLYNNVTQNWSLLLQSSSFHAGVPVVDRIAQCSLNSAHGTMTNGPVPASTTWSWNTLWKSLAGSIVGSPAWHWLQCHQSLVHPGHYLVGILWVRIVLSYDKVDQIFSPVIPLASKLANTLVMLTCRTMRSWN